MAYDLDALREALSSLEAGQAVDRMQVEAKIASALQRDDIPSLADDVAALAFVRQFLPDVDCEIRGTETIVRWGSAQEATSNTTPAVALLAALVRRRLARE